MSEPRVTPVPAESLCWCCGTRSDSRDEHTDGHREHGAAFTAVPRPRRGHLDRARKRRRPRLVVRRPARGRGCPARRTGTGGGSRLCGLAPRAAGRGGLDGADGRGCRAGRGRRAAPAAAGRTPRAAAQPPDRGRARRRGPGRRLRDRGRRGPVGPAGRWSLPAQAWPGECPRPAHLRPGRSWPGAAGQRLDQARRGGRAQPQRRERRPGGPDPRRVHPGGRRAAPTYWSRTTRRPATSRR